MIGDPRLRAPGAGAEQMRVHCAHVDVVHRDVVDRGGCLIAQHHPLTVGEDHRLGFPHVLLAWGQRLPRGHWDIGAIAEAQQFAPFAESLQPAVSVAGRDRLLAQEQPVLSKCVHVFHGPQACAVCGGWARACEGLWITTVM